MSGKPRTVFLVHGRFAFALRPRWLALHLLVLALVVTMVLLGRWQLDVSNEKHFSLQNFGYALQWWAFSAFAVWIWVRIVRDHARATTDARPSSREAAESGPAVPEPVAYRRYVMPSVQQPDAQADPELAAYNEYLAGLAEKDQHEQ
jgi:DNA-binding transcriptional regulator of glucitol operon